MNLTLRHLFVMFSFFLLLYVSNALAGVMNFTYDAKGNLTSIIDPMGKTTTIAYDEKGKPTAITDALGNVTTFTYDGYGNLIKATNPLGNNVQIQYDIIGRLTQITDAKGKKTSYTYDLMSRITEITDALNGKTRFTYDPNGNLITVTDAKTQAIIYTYNVKDKIASMTDQFGKAETYSYDKSDNLIKLTDRKGQVTTFSYDTLNHLIKINYADGSYTNYTYDAAERLTYINDSISGPIQYVYSNVGCNTCGGAIDRVIKEITPSGSISYTYDAIGRRISMTVAGQPTVYYNYDTNSRLTGISASLKSLALNFGFTYDAIGRRTSLSLPNGVKTNYGYDNASNLLNIESLNPLNSILEKITYKYDENNNRKMGNRQDVPVKLPKPMKATYNQANQMITFNGETLIYDANGNLIQKGDTTYTWNARNQLTAINGSDIQVSFKYDALGRRIERTVNGKTINYLYDGLDIVQEIEDHVATVNYIRTLNIDEPLARIKSDGTIRYYQQDALGSVIVLTDEAGIVKTQYTYDPFGNVTISGEASENPFQYTGKPNDGIGLLFYNARYYSPELHRFISEDPIGFLGGDVNLYSYVKNRPTMLVDPLGLSPSLTDCITQCAADQFGITTLLGAGGVGVGMPILPAGGKPGGATKGTSIASKYLSKRLPQNIGSTWAPTLRNPLARSAVLGRVLGRWIPVVGWGLLAYDAVKIEQCVNECMNDNECK